MKQAGSGGNLDNLTPSQISKVWTRELSKLLGGQAGIQQMMCQMKDWTWIPENAEMMLKWANGSRWRQRENAENRNSKKVNGYLLFPGRTTQRACMCFVSVFARVLPVCMCLLCLGHICVGSFWGKDVCGKYVNVCVCVLACACFGVFSCSVSCMRLFAAALFRVCVFVCVCACGACVGEKFSGASLFVCRSSTWIRY